MTDLAICSRQSWLWLHTIHVPPFDFVLGTIGKWLWNYFKYVEYRIHILDIWICWVQNPYSWYYQFRSLCTFVYYGHECSPASQVTYLSGLSRICQSPEFVVGDLSPQTQACMERTVSYVSLIICQRSPRLFILLMEWMVIKTKKKNLTWDARLSVWMLFFSQLVLLWIWRLVSFFWNCVWSWIDCHLSSSLGKLSM